MYLKGTTSYGIMFSSKQGDPLVIGYVDLEYSSDMDDMRSITEHKQKVTYSQGEAKVCCWGCKCVVVRIESFKNCTFTFKP